MLYDKHKGNKGAMLAEAKKVLGDEFETKGRELKGFIEDGAPIKESINLDSYISEYGNEVVADALKILRWELDGKISSPGSFDIAEQYDSSVVVSGGELMMVDPSNPGALTLSDQPYDAGVVGVVSSKPALAISEEGVVDAVDLATMQKNGTAPFVALAGRVDIKVSNENGPVSVGDYLTASSTPGVAMKATKKGYVIGTALSAFDGSVSEGVVKVFVNPVWYPGEVSEEQKQIDALKEDNAALKALVCLDHPEAEICK
jgi:hypothetical protein